MKSTPKKNLAKKQKTMLRNAITGILKHWECRCTGCVELLAWWLSLLTEAIVQPIASTSKEEAMDAWLETAGTEVSIVELITGKFSPSRMMILYQAQEENHPKLFEISRAFEDYIGSKRLQ